MATYIAAFIITDPDDRLDSDTAKWIFKNAEPRMIEECRANMLGRKELFIMPSARMMYAGTPDELLADVKSKLEKNQ